MTCAHTGVHLSVKAGCKKSRDMIVLCVPTMAGPLTRRGY